MADQFSLRRPDGRLSISSLEGVSEMDSRQASTFATMPRYNMTGIDAPIPSDPESFWIQILQYVPPVTATGSIQLSGGYAAVAVEFTGAGVIPASDARCWTPPASIAFEINNNANVTIGSFHRAWNSAMQGVCEFDSGAGGSTPIPPPITDCSQCLSLLCFKDGALSYFVNGTFIPVPNCDDFFNAAACATCSLYHGASWYMPKKFHATLFTPNCPVTNGLVIPMNWSDPGLGGDGCSWNGKACAKSLDCFNKYDPRFPTCDCWVSLNVQIFPYADLNQFSFAVMIYFQEMMGDGTPCNNFGIPVSLGGGSCLASATNFFGDTPCPQPVPFTASPIILCDAGGTVTNDFLVATNEPDCWTGCTGPISAVFSA